MTVAIHIRGRHHGSEKEQHEKAIPHLEAGFWVRCAAHLTVQDYLDIVTDVMVALEIASKSVTIAAEKDCAVCFRNISHKYRLSTIPWTR